MKKLALNQPSIFSLLLWTAVATGCGSTDTGSDAGVGGSGGSDGPSIGGGGGSSTAGTGNQGGNDAMGGSGNAGASGSGTSGSGGDASTPIDDAGSGGGSTGDEGLGGGSTGGSSAGGSDPGGSDSGGSGPVGSIGDNEDDTPIAERDSDGSFECSVSEELINRAPTTWGYSGGNLVATANGGVWVVRSEAEETAPFTPGPYSFLISPIDANGDIGEGTVIPVDDVDLITSPRGIAIEGGLAALWIESGALWFVSLDEGGEILIEPTSIADDASLADANRLELARNADGKIAVVWNDLSTNTPMIAITDESGADATPVPFVEPAGYAPRIVGVGDHFAMLWKSFDPDFVDPSNVRFAELDASGAIDGEPVELTDFDELVYAPAFAGNDLALLPYGDGFLASWTEGSNGNFETGTGAYTALRVQALSASGEPLGESALISDAAPDVDDVEPSFVPWDDGSVALLWSRGEHIYICAGCVPNHSVHLLLLDPFTFTPRSDEVVVSPEMGGLLGRSHAVSGSDLLISLGIQFHVHSEPGFVGLRCE